MPVLTRVEQSNDRVFMPTHAVQRMYLGGLGMSRNMLWPHHAVSYEGLYPGFAALVTENRKDHLRVTLLNLQDSPTSGLLRVWRLVPGRYRVVTGPDANDDDAPDSAATTHTMDLKRYEAIPVTLPPRRPWVVEATLIERATPLWERPDLAVTCLDALYAPDRHVATIVVHNIGTRATGRYRLRVTTSEGCELLSRSMPSLEPPLDCKPRVEHVQVQGIPANASELVATVTPLVPTEEITSCNNTARIPLVALPAEASSFGWARPPDDAGP